MATTIVIIVLVIIIAAFVIYGAWGRRRIYREVDRLEDARANMADQPVAEEIARVKGMTISGETEEKFESWRKDWDEIVGKHLPDIEKALYDAEEKADKYKFSQASEITAAVDAQLASIEEEINNIFLEIEELVHNESDNRRGIEESEQKYEEIKRFVSQNWHTLGSTAPLFDQHMRDLQASFEAFYEAVEQGNQFEAKQLRQKLDEDLEREEASLYAVPDMLAKVRRRLPEEWKSLRAGLYEMEEQGYPMDAFAFEQRLNENEAEAEQLQTRIENLDLDGIAERLTEMDAYNEEVYRILEEEVEARAEVERLLPQAYEGREQLSTRMQTLLVEKEFIEANYRIPSETDHLIASSKRQVDGIRKSVLQLQEQKENKEHSFTHIEMELKQILEKQGEVESGILEAENQLGVLRKDETQAMETLEELKRQNRIEEMRMQRTRLPKLPPILLNEKESADDKIAHAAAALSETPLEMVQVRETVAQAEESVRTVSTMLRRMEEQAWMTERIIQRGNLYRSKEAELDQSLKEAESAFRKGQYEHALQVASSSVRKMDDRFVTEVLQESNMQLTEA
ncbi:septation ring formation regulator [Marinococcus luteus]|uniref:Septation ring formation regulator n=1 Tax=Marinococcus luteus TaxID=1122204 RepID=A0A1H2VQV7_9BACI|nr:septation ring formation regulator EzrA [Marinococcus luteus]SDW70344.1 septation ring formation regulator [Marinococcus luteus]